MTFLVLALAGIIGIILGLVGAGGAIIAVPILVYLMGIDQSVASGYALFTIAIASAVGAVPYVRRTEVYWPAVYSFGSVALVTTGLVRRFVVPMIPQSFIVAGDKVTDDTFLMIVFALMMFIAAIGMIRAGAGSRMLEPAPASRLALAGFVVGVLSAVLGVGGGFLIVPALVLWSGIDMKKAVGTSLVLISANSTVGVLADMTSGMEYDWTFLLTFTGLMSAGILVGARLSRHIDGERLKTGFGWLVLAIGTIVMSREFWKLFIAIVE